MEVSLVKTVVCATRSTKQFSLNDNILHQSGEELKRCSSLDDALDYLKAYMIEDLIKVQNDYNYGVELMDKHDQEWEQDAESLVWYINGFNYQSQDSDTDCGYTKTKVRYHMVVLHY